ncbi:unnamed protein product, partial [Discosporangium mesarthrocarpum]
MSAVPGEDPVSLLVAAGFERHAVEVALLSTDGNIDQAASLILSWGSDPPPTLGEASSASPLRLRPLPSATAPQMDVNASPVVPEVPLSSRRAADVEARDRVRSKQREREMREAQKLRKEAKRRREQEIVMWQEQREDAKLRKAGGRIQRPGASARVAASGGAG